MSTGGYFDFVPQWFQEPAFVGNLQLVVGMTLSGEDAGGGVAVRTAGGRFIHQFAAEHPNQPLGGGPTVIAMGIGPMNSLDDERHINALPAKATLAPIEVFIHREISDAWLITTNRTQWTLNHSFAYATTSGFSVPLQDPTIRVVDVDESIDLTLTVVTGAPATGEVQVDTSADGTFITTFAGDLDSHVGKRLVVYYFPLMQAVFEPIAWDRPTDNILEHQLPLAISPPARDWGADTP